MLMIFWSVKCLNINLLLCQGCYSFLNVLYLTCEMHLKVTIYFAADSGKSLICKVFIEAEMYFSACMQNSA